MKDIFALSEIQQVPLSYFFPPRFYNLFLPANLFRLLALFIYMFCFIVKRVNSQKDGVGGLRTRFSI